MRLPDDKHAAFNGRIVILGFGSVGQGMLPLLLRHINLKLEQIEILKPGGQHLEAAHEHGVRHVSVKLDRGNYRELLEPRLGSGDLLLNLSVDVSSKALMALCQQRQALYLDACTEPWPGGYTDRSVPPAQRTNYALRSDALSLRNPDEEQTTAIITLGANPGLVSFFVKQALLNLAGPGTEAPGTRDDWARLAQELDVRVIHVAERDTQVSNRRKQLNEFVNTWSTDGFISEGMQPAELGWGTHERHFPRDGVRQSEGTRAAIYIERPGAGTRVRTWTPLAGAFHGFMITHAESISIAEHLTVGDPDQPDYRPTVHYAYHPCDDAVLSLHELAGRQWRSQEHKRLMRDDIESGRDELGVLLMGGKGAYWYGSQLTIEEARKLCPYNSATTLQVAAPIMAGVAWAMRNRRCGILEPDDLPYDEMLHMAGPYLGNVVGIHGDWTPLQDRGKLFDENIDRTDPWQFVNFRVD